MIGTRGAFGSLKCRGDGEPLHADEDARAVHQAEHLPHAHVRLAADEDAAAAVVLAEVEDGGRGGTDPELVLDRGGDDVVRLAERAVLVHPHLGNDEEREPLRPGGRALDAREHEVHDVVAEVVVARRDPALGAGDRVDVALEVPRAGLGRADVGAGVRLGETHRPREAAVHHRRQEARLVLGSREALDQVGGAVGEAGVHVEGGVGAALQLLENDGDRVRAAEAAGVERHRERHEAELEELPPRLLEPRRRARDAVLEDAAHPVRRPVERPGVLVHEAQALVDGRVALLAREVRERVVREDLIDREMLVERELDGAKIRLVMVHRGFRHGSPPRGRATSR
jgi:hypothetical protein